MEELKNTELYVKKWIDIGLSTARIDKDKGIKTWQQFNKCILKGDENVPVIFMDSPIESWITVVYLYNIVIEKEEIVTPYTIDPLLKQKILDQYQKFNGDNKYDSLIKKIEEVNEIEKSSLSQFIHPYLNCAHWSGYYSFYDYINKELNIVFENQAEWDMLLSLADFSMIYTFEQFCVISEKPISIHMVDKKLHNEFGPSIEYADGFKIYSLNGIRVPEELVMTPSAELSINLFQTETNADVKAEFIRKYGVERLLEHGELVDSYKSYNYKVWTESEYELYDLKLLFEKITKHDRCLFLKMKNQTTGIYHVEGVNPDCTTIASALRFRDGGDENDYEIVTIK